MVFGTFFLHIGSSNCKENEVKKKKKIASQIKRSNYNYWCFSFLWRNFFREKNISWQVTGKFHSGIEKKRSTSQVFKKKMNFNIVEIETNCRLDFTPLIETIALINSIVPSINIISHTQNKISEWHVDKQKALTPFGEIKFKTHRGIWTSA